MKLYSWYSKNSTFFHKEKTIKVDHGHNTTLNFEPTKQPKNQYNKTNNSTLLHKHPTVLNLLD